MYSRIKDAYFAGLIDGEGHIGFTSCGGNFQPTIQVKMTCEKAIRALHEYFGGSVQMRKPDKPHHKPQFTWRVRYSAAAPVIARVRPYLLTKQDAADVV